ncbi:MAG: beta-lactamase family protein [Planctomycetaceae bacterium]|jgi:CubicO group peptidase (beta-lactamase class C family)|nr:beta-lactamase family protein [Planctomycetaceae bacterium]
MFAALLACLCLQETVAGPQPQTQADRIFAACEEYQRRSHAVGVTVAIALDGQVILNGGWGERDREAQQPMLAGTLVRLASVSKPVTAALAALVAHEGKLALDAAISTHVPDLPETLQPLTLRGLLSHTAGVRHYRNDRKDNATGHCTTREALALFVNDPLIAPPGTKYSYSTHAFTLVTATLEGATKQDFRTLLRERIATPFAPTLDCEDATETKELRSAAYELVLGTALRARVREDLSWKYAGGGMESSAPDLARFADALLHAKIVPAEVRDALWTRQKLSDGKEIDYGLGWSVPEKGRVVSHTGSQQGSSTALSVDRESGHVVVVLSNTSGSDASDLAAQLRRILRENR